MKKNLMRVNKELNKLKSKTLHVPKEIGFGITSAQFSIKPEPKKYGIVMYKNRGS